MASFLTKAEVALGVTASAQLELERLLEHYEQSVFGFLIVLLNNRDSARDCLQDTFLRAYQNLMKGKPVTVQWLYRVARNRAIDEVRHRQREQQKSEPLDETVLDQSDISERTRSVHRALLKLSPDDREVLYLAEVDGFTSFEIGEMLGVRAGAVRMRLSRAHLRFKVAYESAR